MSQVTARRLLRRYWLATVVGALTLTVLLAPAAVDAQAGPTATPDVNTVPPIELLRTPTPAPPPVQGPIVTATALPAPTVPGPDEIPADTGAEPSDDSGNGSTTTGGGADSNPTSDSGSGVDNSVGNSDEPPRGATTLSGDSGNAAARSGPQLTLSMLPDRAFAWQGQRLQLELTIRNVGDQPATAVMLESDLPTAFLVEAVTTDGGVVEQTPTAGAPQVRITWSSLAPGATATVTLTLVITPATPNGHFIDVFAVVRAQDLPPVVAGITLAMPPAQPPRFD